ncbi:unnamed protein product [Protopolystoma xenopodis]|uniref:Uncharacterized protein n=1 Tax=Protopolystoma xenopodis TaxID=117903 RepID=A0A3S5B906_9PLAT|nr:unnamed protein product [Protopolystoma xenopodis]
MLRLTRLTDDTDYDAVETSGNVASPRSDSGNNHAYYTLQTRGDPPGLPANMTKLRKLGQTTTTLIAYDHLK